MPYPVLGLGCVVIGLLLTFVFPIQRQRLSNQLWDLVTLALFIVGVWWIAYWDNWSNFCVGLIAGLVAIVIRDIRLWQVRATGETYRRSHRYYWYGQARNAWGRRRRRY